MVFEITRILALTTFSFLVALLIATPLTIKILKFLNFNKQIRNGEEAPIFSKMHQGKAGTPTMGGVIIWGTVLFVAIFFWVMNFWFDGFFGTLNFIDRAQTYLPLTAMMIAALVGLADDLFGVFKIGGGSGGLKVRHKLVLYSIIAAIGAWWFFFRLEWYTLMIPFYGNIEIGYLYIPLFMFVIISSAFSANETDGLDGLLGGVSLFIFASLMVVAFSLGRYDLAALSGVMVGSLLAFLWFNIYPARFFMGDTGAMALGITIGVIAMLTNTVLLLPFFAFIFVMESVSVILQVLSKTIRKKKIF
ncbi:MAG: phospho-N-acetylmuramoyl-pentapeptide-transferase, partial [Candidatus Liptonbacteria bacterium CG11_big_fil_rev_8_21_14_0_20_35_14]